MPNSRQICQRRAGPHDQPAMEVIASITDVERRAILRAIEQLNGDRPLAAKLLGIGKTTLYRKLKEYQETDESTTSI